MIVRMFFPVAIGGIGGSGTRLIAKILMDCGYFLGSDRNKADDNLWFSLLFRRVETYSLGQSDVDTFSGIFTKAMQGGSVFSTSEELIVQDLARHARPPHSVAWLEERKTTLLATSATANPSPWGWKEPNTHIVVDRLLATMPDLKYIHLVRNGLDMAYSDNQNQLKLWGKQFFPDGFEVSPFWSLRFWHVANLRVIDFFERRPNQFLLLNFDRLCVDPERELARLLAFIDVPATRKAISRLAKLPQRPESTGRFKQFSLDAFDSDDVRFVEHLGFDCQLP